MYDRFEGDYPKLSKVNSFTCGGLLFYIKKHDGSYIVWEYKTKIKIVATDKKDRALDYIHDRIDELKKRLNDKESKW